MGTATFGFVFRLSADRKNKFHVKIFTKRWLLSFFSCLKFHLTPYDYITTVKKKRKTVTVRFLSKLLNTCIHHFLLTMQQLGCLWPKYNLLIWFEIAYIWDLSHSYHHAWNNLNKFGTIIPTIYCWALLENNVDSVYIYWAPAVHVR